MTHRGELRLPAGVSVAPLVTGTLPCPGETTGPFMAAKSTSGACPFTGTFGYGAIAKERRVDEPDAVSPGTVAQLHDL